MKKQFLINILLLTLLAITSISCSVDELEIEDFKVVSSDSNPTPPSEGTGKEDELEPND